MPIQFLEEYYRLFNSLKIINSWYYHNIAILKTYACLTPRIPFPLGLRFFAELDSIVAMVVVNNIQSQNFRALQRPGQHLSYIFGLHGPSTRGIPLWCIPTYRRQVKTPSRSPHPIQWLVRTVLRPIKLSWQVKRSECHVSEDQ